MGTRTIGWGWVLLLAAGIVGCGDDTGGGGRDAGMMMGTCEPEAPADFTGVDRTRDPACPPAANWLVGLTGRVVDETGAPMRCARPQLCIRVSGADAVVCLNPPTTGDDGQFAILVPEESRCAIRAAMRVRLPMTDTGTTYCHVDLSAPTEGIVDVTEAYEVITTQRAASIPPLGDDGLERTVRFPDGLEMVVTPGMLGLGGDYPSLAARHVGPSDVPSCMLDDAPTPPLRAIWAFSQEAGIDGSGFPLRIPNDEGLAAGTPVELWLIGGLNTMLVDGTPVEEAVWTQFGMGTVSAAGDEIESEDGSALPYLSWMGWR